MHTSSGYPLYCYEADQRRYYYPPPYWYNGDWYYAYPWLWIDGDKHGAYQYSQWETKITNRMSHPAPVSISIWGDYTPTDGTGTIYVQFRNDSTSTITGRILFVITEDSLYFVASNGDLWHNHVARDYLPDHNGEVVIIPPGDSITLNRSFTIDPTWDEEKCEIVTWIQDDYMQPDTTKEIWQGSLTKLLELTGIEKEVNNTGIHQTVNPIPNPCTNGTMFPFTLPRRTHYTFAFYDISGRLIRTIKGVSSGNKQSVSWNLKDSNGIRINSGIYLYKFESEYKQECGKIVVW